MSVVADWGRWLAILDTIFHISWGKGELGGVCAGDAACDVWRDPVEIGDSDAIASDIEIDHDQNGFAGLAEDAGGLRNIWSVRDSLATLALAIYQSLICTYQIFAIARQGVKQ
jgi:hypothetical protein